jgi:hypothetical protein
VILKLAIFILICQTAFAQTASTPTHVLQKIKQPDAAVFFPFKRKHIAQLTVLCFANHSCSDCMIKTKQVYRELAEMIHDQSVQFIASISEAYPQDFDDLEKIYPALINSYYIDPGGRLELSQKYKSQPLCQVFSGDGQWKADLGFNSSIENQCKSIVNKLLPPGRGPHQ